MNKKTHWKKLINPKYSGAYELLPGEEKTLTIKSITQEEVIGQKNHKSSCVVAYFEEQPKPIILNSGNRKTIIKLYKSNYIEDWIGKKITFKTEPGTAFGEKTDLLVVKMCIPKSENVPDYSAQIKKLEDCKSIDELKAVFTSLKPHEQAACQTVKDEMKVMLGGIS